MTKIMRTRGIAFLLAFIMVFCTVYFTVQTPVIVYAQESKTYSSVLDDLKKDKSLLNTLTKKGTLQSQSLTIRMVQCLQLKE